jgi:hypothetical protein
MGNIVMHGQISSAKWYRRISLRCSTHVGMSCSRSYSRGATDGRRAHAELALLVDQASVCADPHATFVIFLP